MQTSQQSYFNVAGVNPNPGANIVYIWCHDRVADSYVLIGSGHIVTQLERGRPPGIQVGQFSVTFPLPAEFSASDVSLTDDSASEGRLERFTLTACSGGGVLHAGAVNSGSARASAHSNSMKSH
ncbi:hypothetical protein [Aestuariivirga sp.]|uniref:hypothetical protein n=1 Tax=Aestuariivirga sp. TaxID=2650926 RepID=UPI003BAC9EA3